MSAMAIAPYYHEPYRLQYSVHHTVSATAQRSAPAKGKVRVSDCYIGCVWPRSPVRALRALAHASLLPLLGYSIGTE